MLFKTFSSIATLFSALSFISSVTSAPIVELDHSARDILARATPAAPHFVVYSDEWVSGENGPPATSAINVSNTDQFVRIFLLKDQ